ncbi:MAG: hypothetical protein IPL72_00260 [Sulfuritalea sp.]|nr:hypothetical protein [Sulfuritalea sp.]
MMEAERLRRQREGAGTLPPVVPVGPGRSVPELVATVDIDAETESRLAAERTALESLDRRIEEEAAALAAAQRNERGAAQLAAAAAARAANEANLTRLAQERATAERRAADRAAAQLKAELAVEAAAKARVAAEQDANQQARRRVELEAEASRAAALLKSEAAARAGQALRDAVDSASGQGNGTTATATAEPVVVVPSTVVVREADHLQERLPAAFGRLIAAVALSMGIGLSAGFWLGGSTHAPAAPPGSDQYPPTAIDRDTTRLRLDHELRAAPSETPRRLTGNP